MKIADCKIGMLVMIMNRDAAVPRPESMDGGHGRQVVPKIGHIVGYVYNVQNQPELIAKVELANDHKYPISIHPVNLSPYDETAIAEYWAKQREPA